MTTQHATLGGHVDEAQRLIEQGAEARLSAPAALAPVVSNAKDSSPSALAEAAAPEGPSEGAADEIELIVDPETGEILELPTGPDRLGFVVRRLDDAKAQEKAWAAYAGMLSAILVREQPEQKAVYDDLQVAIVFGKRQVQDMPAIREFIANAELAREDLTSLALAAKGFEPEALTEAVRVAVEDMTSTVDNKPYPRISRVRRRAVGV